jgi:hypothetical protein
LTVQDSNLVTYASGLWSQTASELSATVVSLGLEPGRVRVDLVAQILLEERRLALHWIGRV